MLKSMTGFGRGQAQGNNKAFLVELKSVNHRYTDLFIKMPRQLNFLEDKIRETIGKLINRGKVDVFISFEDTGDESANVVVNNSLAKAYISSLNMLKEQYSLSDDISLSLVARFPDILKIDKPQADEEQIWLLLSEALSNAISELLKMRENEGMAIKQGLIERISITESMMNQITVKAPKVVSDYKTKLESRLKELIDQNVDEARISLEIALFADRSNIDEEVDRMKSHVGQFREILDKNQPAGRKLDFLVQEMNREINTIGSKANDIEIVRLVVDLKSEIEKIREQIQNIE